MDDHQTVWAQQRVRHKFLSQVIALIGLLVLVACARSADVMPLNEAANAVGIPKFDMVLYGTGHGPVTVTMPNGEVLTGHYLLMIGGAVATGFGTAVGPRGTSMATGTSTIMPMQSPFVLQAVGDRGTTIACQGTAGGMGHGSMTCTTNHGAQYQVIF